MTIRLILSLRAIGSNVGRVSDISEVRLSNGGAIEAHSTEYFVPGVELLVEEVS